MLAEYVQSISFWVLLHIVFYAVCFLLGAAAIIGILTIFIISDKTVQADLHRPKVPPKEGKIPMIKIKYDSALVHAGGTVMKIHNNIKDRVKYEAIPAVTGEAEINITIEGFTKDLNFDLSYAKTYAIDVVVIKLDDNGEVSVEQMSEVSFNSQKHMVTA